MSERQISISDENLQKCFAIAESKNTPAWAQTVSSPLTFEPWFVRTKNNQLRRIFLGNTGLVINNSFPHFMMTFAPNGDISPNHNTLEEAHQNIRVLAQALLRLTSILVSLPIDDQQKTSTIEAFPHYKMFLTLFRLFEKNPKIICGYLNDDDKYWVAIKPHQAEIALKSNQLAKLSYLAEKAACLENKLSMVNPLLKASGRFETNSGNQIYTY